LTLRTANVNTLPSLGQYAPLIRLRRMALYKSVLIDWLIDWLLDLALYLLLLFYSFVSQPCLLLELLLMSMFLSCTKCECGAQESCMVWGSLSCDHGSTTTWLGSCVMHTTNKILSWFRLLSTEDCRTAFWQELVLHRGPENDHN